MENENDALLAEIKKLILYDSETGLFHWLVERTAYRGHVSAGDVAGTLLPGKSGGYIRIGVLGKHYRAHRLAWWFMTGEPVPEGREIDHKDRIRSHNWWDNLRLATRIQNTMNAGVRSDSKTGVRGVSIVARYGRIRYLARIKVDGRIIDLGYCDTIQEAAGLRKAAEIKYHGEFRNSGVQSNP